VWARNGTRSPADISLSSRFTQILGLVVTRTGVASNEQQTIASWRAADAALSTWLVDPGGSTIGLLQFKDKGLG
jgi:hypothetical protein